MCFAAGRNDFADQIWLARRRVGEPWYRLWRGVVRIIHRCQSPIPALKGCYLTPLTRTQSSEQEYSYLTASKRHPSTPYSRNTSQSFSRGTRPYTFPSSTTHVYTWACSQDFLKICWRVEICSVVLRPRRKPDWVSSSFGSIIFAASWHTLFLGGLANRCPGS